MICKPRSLNYSYFSKNNLLVANNYNMSVKSTRHNKDSALNSRKLGICAQNCVETKNVIIVARAN